MEMKVSDNNTNNKDKANSVANQITEKAIIIAADEDIKWYVDNDKYILERCGYSIHGKAAIFVDKVVGDYNTVLGISISKVYSKLKELGYSLNDFELEEN